MGYDFGSMFNQNQVAEKDLIGEYQWGEGLDIPEGLSSSAFAPKDKTGVEKSGGDFMGNSAGATAIAGNAMDFFGKGMEMMSDVNLSTKERMDERGSVTHDVDWAGNVGGMAVSGAMLGGSIVPGWGHVIGAGVGLIAGTTASVIDSDRQPDAKDIRRAGESFDLGNMMKTMRGEDTFAVQQTMTAEDGLNVEGETKQIEVEQDELVLRKTGRAFKKVADFKGGKPHEMGGEQYVAQEGDIIIPGKDRLKVNRMLKNRRWSAIESLRQQLPTDTGQEEAALGMTVGDPPTKKKKSINVYTYNPEAEFESETTLKRNGKYYDTTFTREFERGKSVLEQQYDTVNHVPIYDKGGMPDAIRKNVGGDVMIMDHSGDYIGGSPITAIGNAITDSKAKDCYMGICRGEEYQKDFNTEGSTANMHYTTADKKWEGFNPGKKGMEGIFPGGSVQYKSGKKVEYKMGTKAVRIGYKKGTKEIMPSYATGTSEISTTKGNPIPYEEALRLAKEAGLPFPDASAAQMGLETGWGKTQVAKNNVFNLHWDARSVKKMKKKYPDMKVTKTAKKIWDGDDYYYFMEFESPEDGFRGHKAFIEDNPRYSKALKAGSSEEYVEEMAAAGYALDKKYGEKILNIMDGKSTESEGEYRTETPTYEEYKEAAGSGPTMSEEDYTSQVSKFGGRTEADLMHIENARINNEISKAKREATSFNTDAENLGIYNNATPKGKAAGNIVKKIGTQPRSSYVSSWGSMVGDPTTQKGLKQQTVGYTDDLAGVAMQGEMEKFYKWLESGIEDKKGGDVGNAVMQGFHNVTAARDAVLFGRSKNSSKLNRIGEILASEDVHSINGILDLAVKEGILTDNGLKVVQNMTKHPENYQTGQGLSGQATDILAVVGNPKGLVNLFKLGGKGLVSGGKLTTKGVKALFKSKTWKDLKNGSKAMYNKAAEGIVNMAKSSTEYDNLGSIDEVRKALAEIESTATNKTVVNNSKTLSENLKVGYDFMKKMPEKMGAALRGRNPSEWKKATQQMYDLTGKSASELKGMDVKQIQNLVDKRALGLADELILAEKNAKNMWSDYGSLKKASVGYEKQIKALEKVADKGAGWQDKMDEAKRLLDQGYTQIDALESDIRAGEAALDTKKVNWEQIAKLEGVQSSKEFGDKFRVIQKTEEAIAKNLKNLEGVEGIPDDIKRMARQQNAEYAVYAESLKDYNAAKKGFGAAANAQGKLNSLTNVLENVETARKQGLKAAQSSQGKTTSPRAAVATFDRLAESYPQAMKLIMQDKAFVDDMMSGAVAGAQLVNALRKRGINPKDIEEITKEWEDITPAREEDIQDVPTREKAETIKLPDTVGIDTDAVDPIEVEGPDQPVPDYEVPAGEKKKMSIGSNVAKGIGLVADYMPALYNIVRGTEKPSKVPRNFANPQTRKYVNMGQPQMNAIDQAFETSLANARNLSGGMMSNYRSNVEAAWSKKLDAQGKVNLNETMRADQVASQNIAVKNRADEFNVQVNTKADIMDMQSEATTKSFMAQGMQDIANINAVKRKDASAEKNQELMLEMIGSENFDLYGYKG